MNIEKATLNDTQEIAELFTNTIHKINIQNYTLEQIEVWSPIKIDYEKWEKRFKKSKPYIAKKENKIVGFFGYRTDFDEIETEEEVDYIGSVLQTFVDYGEISDIVETHEKVKISLEFNEILKELEEKGYFLFGERTTESYASIDDCPIATLLIKKKDSKEIIKMNFDEEEVHNKTEK